MIGARAGRVVVMCAVAVVAAVSGESTSVSALGNDDAYTWAEVSDRWAAPPASATNLNLGLREGREVSLPFAFPYWGGTYDSMWVTSLGYVLFAPEIGTPAQSYAVTGRFPPSLGTTVIADSTDGMLAVYSTDLDLGSQGDVFVHTEGQPPRRTVVVSWVNCTLRSGNAGLSFQARMEEETGLITLAYEDDDGTGDWPTAVGVSDYVFGVEAPRKDDNRWVVPDSLREGSLNQGHPGTDYEFTPVKTTISGRLQMDELVSDATGIGNSVVADVAVAGVPVRFRWGSGFVRNAGAATTDANGDFSIDCLGLPDDGSRKGTLYVLAETDAATVRATAGGAPLEKSFKTDVALDKDTDVGTVTLDSTNDSGAAIREPLHIAMTVTDLHDTASPHVTETVEPVDVLFDPASSAASGYTAAGTGTPPSLRVASAGATNPDGWDDAMIARVYGRHVLTTSSGAPSTAADATFDGVTDGPNAFAEAIGYYLHTLATGNDEAIDGLGAASANVIDLEDPNPATPGGSDVAAWVAANLYDLTDGTGGEAHDRSDGSAPERVLTILDAMSGSIDAESFYVGWGAVTPDAGALARLTIHHGIVQDDTAEPNDDVGEPFGIGSVPMLVEDRVLNIYDEDWFEVTLDAAASALVVELQRTDDASAPGRPEAELQIRSDVDALLASGAPGDTNDLLVATTGALPAGTVRVRVRHTSGNVALPYRVQAFVPLDLTALPLPDWTQDVPFDEPLGAVGGLAPLEFDVVSGELPPGLSVGVVGDRVVGLPNAQGTFNVTFRARDAGVPQHTARGSQTLTINRPIEVDLDAFIGFPLGRAFTVERDDPGGTQPRTFVISAGVLPDGIGLDAAELRLSGTATTTGASTVKVKGFDAPGSTDEPETTLVVCVEGLPAAKGTPADVALDGTAAGYWFDALTGSTLTLSAGTEKKQPKRALLAVLVGPDGRTVLDGKRKGKNGKASAKAVAPLSGRYFFILAAQPGPATRLLGTIKVKLPKKGKHKVADFGQNEQFAVTLGALTGAELSFKANGDRRSGMTVSILRLVSPSGQIQQGATLGIVDKKGKLSFKTILDESGTWTVVLRGSGAPGKLVAGYKLKQPKGVAFSAD